MSILGKIFGRIFPRAQAAQPGAAQAPSNPSIPAGAPGQPDQASLQGGRAAGPTATVTAERVDIAAVLDGLAAQNRQKLNWRNSIVDLMKLVGLESSLQERRELADELGYSGDKGDTATMNIWLHKQVMRKLEDNGGKVPADLKD